MICNNILHSNSFKNVLFREISRIFRSLLEGRRALLFYLFIFNSFLFYIFLSEILLLFLCQTLPCYISPRTNFAIALSLFVFTSPFLLYVSVLFSFYISNVRFLTCLLLSFRFFSSFYSSGVLHSLFIFFLLPLTWFLLYSLLYYCFMTLVCACYASFSFFLSCFDLHYDWMFFVGRNRCTVNTRPRLNYL